MMVEECYMLGDVARGVRIKGEHIEHSKDTIDGVCVESDTYIYGGGVWNIVKMDGLLFSIRQTAITKYFDNLK